MVLCISASPIYLETLNLPDFHVLCVLTALVRVPSVGVATAKESLQPETLVTVTKQVLWRIFVLSKQNVIS